MAFTVYAPPPTTLGRTADDLEGNIELDGPRCKALGYLQHKTNFNPQNSTDHFMHDKSQEKSYSKPNQRRAKTRNIPTPSSSLVNNCASTKMSHSTCYSNKAVVGSVFESNHNSASSRYKRDAILAAAVALAPKRLNAFIADEILHPAYSYGSKTTAQACERMEELLKLFEKSFDNTNNGKGRA